jgi:predicted metal-dependent hydrolase
MITSNETHSKKRVRLILVLLILAVVIGLGGWGLVADQGGAAQAAETPRVLTRPLLSAAGIFPFRLLVLETWYPLKWQIWDLPWREQLVS